jgi:hypothetical protein
MGAVVSCVSFRSALDLSAQSLTVVQIKAVFQTIGNVLMAIVNGIGAVLKAIINGIVALFDIIISCLTCGRGGGGRRKVGGHHTSRV